MEWPKIYTGNEKKYSSFVDEARSKKKRFLRTGLICLFGAGLLYSVGSNDLDDYSAQRPSSETQELRFEEETYRVDSDYFGLG